MESDALKRFRRPYVQRLTSSEPRLSVLPAKLPVQPRPLPPVIKPERKYVLPPRLESRTPPSPARSFWRKALIGTAIIAGVYLRVKEVIDIVDEPVNTSSVPFLDRNDPSLQDVERNAIERNEREAIAIDGFSDDPHTPGFTRAEVAFLVDAQPGALADSCIHRLRYSEESIAIPTDYGFSGTEAGHLSCLMQEIVVTRGAFYGYERTGVESAAFTVVHEAGHSLFYGIRIPTVAAGKVRRDYESHVHDPGRIRFLETEDTHNPNNVIEDQLKGGEYEAELYDAIIHLPVPSASVNWHTAIRDQLHEIRHVSLEEAETDVTLFERTLALKYPGTEPREIHARTYRAIQIVLTHRLNRLG